MRNLIVLIVATITMMHVSCNSSELEETSAETVIVKPAKAEFLEERAATELQKYILAMTGRSADIVTDETVNKLTEGKIYFVVGSTDRNKLANKLAASIAGKAGLEVLTKLPDHPDGFVVASADVGGAKVISLAGRKPIGTLYAAYDYLERDCGVGFFQDGEHVPLLTELPTAGISRSEKPRFDYRQHFAWNAHRALKKYFSHWWTVDEWKREFDWMVKRRMNMMRIDINYYTSFAGDAYELAFPEIGPEPEEKALFTLAGFPNGSKSWPTKYRRKMVQEFLAYGRKLNIRFIYTGAYASVPLRFVKIHQEYKYLPANQYGPSRQIAPGDPNAYEVEKKYLAKIIELYGTDHLYMYTPYCELDVGGGSHQKNMEMRIKAAKGILKLIGEVDPEGVWVTDSWDMFPMGQMNPGDAKKYFDAFPDDKVFIYETTADVEPIYRRYGGWYGKKWAYGVINAVARTDNLHGNPKAIIAGVNDAAANFDNCTGLFMIPEMTHHNILIWDLVTHLAWQPKGVEFSAFLKDYARRRYGRELEEPMAEAWEKIAKAVYRNAGLWGVINDQSIWYKWWKPEIVFDTDGTLNGRLKRAEQELPLLAEGMGMMLRHADKQKDNDCYTEDVVVVFRAYAATMFRYETANAWFAFRAGDKAAYELHRDRAMIALQSISDVLAVCPSYSVNKTIAEASSVPGASKFIPEAVRQACVNWRYVVNDVYEQFEGDYIPKTKAYFAHLDMLLAKGVTNAGPGGLAPLFSQIDQTYRKQGWTGEPKTGDPVKIVAQSVKKMNATAEELAARKEADRMTMRLRQPSRGCMDFDVVLPGNDTPSFRVMAPHMIRAEGIKPLTGIHVVPGIWKNTKSGKKGTLNVKDKIQLTIDVIKGQGEIEVSIKVKNLTDKELKNVYASIAISPSHLPGLPSWSNVLFFPKAPVDRLAQGKIWYEKLAPHGLKALTADGWVLMHPKPDAPSADGVHEYNTTPSKEPNALGCGAVTPDGGHFLYEAWNRSGHHKTPCPGNAGMDMDIPVTKSLAPGAEAEIRGIIGIHKGSWNSLAERIQKFRKSAE